MKSKIYQNVRVVMISGNETGIVFEDGAQGTSRALVMSTVAYLSRRYNEHFTTNYSSRVDGRLEYYTRSENRFGIIYIF